MVVDWKWVLSHDKIDHQPEWFLRRLPRTLSPWEHSRPSSGRHRSDPAISPRGKRWGWCLRPSATAQCRSLVTPGWRYTPRWVDVVRVVGVYVTGARDRMCSGRRDVQQLENRFLLPSGQCRLKSTSQFASWRQCFDTFCTHLITYWVLEKKMQSSQSSLRSAAAASAWQNTPKGNSY